MGNAVEAVLDQALGGSDGDGSTRDGITDLIASPFHIAGHAVSIVAGAATAIVARGVGIAASLAGGLVGGVHGLLNGDLAGAGRAIVGGIEGAMRSVTGGIGVVGGLIYDAVEQLLGPGGNSNSHENVTRTSWVDTDGHTHWGSLRDINRATDFGTVASVKDGGELPPENRTVTEATI